MDSTAASLKTSVRIMSELLFSSGDLSSVQLGSVTGVEGIRLHQKVYSKIETENSNASIYPEFSLCTSFLHDNICLEVSGRADCIAVSTSDDNSKAITPVIFEIKSHNKQEAHFDLLFREHHLSQLKMYGYMYASQNPQVTAVTLCMRYVSIHTLHHLERKYNYSKNELEKFFNESCKKYIESARQRLDYIEQRNRSIKSLQFPYDGLRNGQKVLMQRVLSTIKNKQVLFAQAPTGIGKTISVLYPAIKALTHNWNDKIFYLTAKKATREVARKSLGDMREKGLCIRSILLHPKEALCPNPEIFCEPLKCPYAIGYYDRRKDALKAVADVMDITPFFISKIAQKHLVCPHELSLDISLSCDVIMGDYNHAFHPRIKLERFFSGENGVHLLLIDEAHNLIERARDMYSAQLTRSRWLEFASLIHGLNKKIEGHCKDILSYFDCTAHYLNNEKSAFSHTESDVEDKPTFITKNFQAISAPPKMLYASLWRLCFHLAKQLDDLPIKYNRKKILDVYFEARFFIHILEQHFDNTYIYSCKIIDNNDLVLSLKNLDAADKLNKIIINKHSTVFFSATLSPVQYYQMMLLGEKNDVADHLVLESPFPKEHFKPVIYTGISTAFQNRVATRNEISSIITGLLDRIKGHYICFFPSFSYLRMIYNDVFSYFEEHDHIDIIVQKPDMNDKDKRHFLARFNHYGKKTLLAFAVLGGHFAEGIDLVGDKLNGAIIIGAGLPQISPEREIITQYYQEKFNDGFAYAYRFPGWEKVLQASGRVIRDENDTGFTLLLDHRYNSLPYRSLIPRHWDTYFAEDSYDVIDYISDLFSIEY